MENKNENEDEDKKKALEEFMGNLISGVGHNSPKTPKEDLDIDEDNEYGKLIKVEEVLEGDWTLKFKTWENTSGNITKVSISKLNGDLPKELPHNITKLIDDRLPKIKNFSLLKNESNGVQLNNLFNNPNFIKERTLNDFKADNSLKSLVIKFWGENKNLSFDKDLDKAIEVEDYELAAKLRDRKTDLANLKEETLRMIKQKLEAEDIMGVDMAITSFKQIIEDIKNS